MGHHHSGTHLPDRQSHHMDRVSPERNRSRDRERERDRERDERRDRERDRERDRGDRYRERDRDRGRSREEPPVDPDRAIFVGNLDLYTTVDEVRDMFEGKADVRKIDMKQGYAFVFLEAGHHRAIRELDGTLHGRKRLRIELARGDGLVKRYHFPSPPLASNKRPAESKAAGRGEPRIHNGGVGFG